MFFFAVHERVGLLQGLNRDYSGEVGLPVKKVNFVCQVQRYDIVIKFHERGRQTLSKGLNLAAKLDLLILRHLLAF